MGSAVLYISYDGMLEPLGQSQVVAYLEKLAAGRAIHLLSFEKPSDLANIHAVSALRHRLDAAGIAWHPRRYHKTPPVLSSVYDLVIGSVSAWPLVRKQAVSIVHARSLLPAAMGLVAAKWNGARLLFDIRGLWVDERVDAGLVRRGGLVHRILQRLERNIFRSADHIVTLTDASVPELRQNPRFGLPECPVTVIRTCCDLATFAPSPATGRPLTLGFVGSARPWSLFDSVLELFSAVRRRRPDARLLVVNRGDHAFIRERLARAGIGSDHCEIVMAEHGAIARLIGNMSAGAAMRTPTYSQIACAPTKVGEYLACGVPAIVNRGVGDVAELVAGRGVGIVLDDLSAESIERAAEDLLTLLADPGVAGRCRAAAEALFSLDSGVAAYRKIYNELEGLAAVPRSAY